LKKRTKKLLFLRVKVFWFFFSKKNCFLPLALFKDMDRLEYDSEQATHALMTAREARTTRDARTWLERAHRFASGDIELMFSLASTRLADGDARGARTLFARLAEQYPTREVLAGLAACASALGDPEAASAALARALSNYTPSKAVLSLAARCARSAGWCGLDETGRLTIEGPAPTQIALDGVVVVPGRHGELPDSWLASSTLAVTHGGSHLLGSPIDLAARRRAEGYVALAPGGVEGWTWHPAAPEVDPALRVVQGGHTETITASKPMSMPPPAPPLARPRGFFHACETAKPLRILGADGRDILGSPLGGPDVIPKAAPPRATKGTAVIVAVYRDLAATRACLESVLATIAAADTVIVVNDASPEPELVEYVRGLAARKKITLLDANSREPGRNMGFPSAANTGLAAAAGRDAVLLNSDTIVFPGWLAGLRAATQSAADIGTATPFSNDATIFGYPDPASPAPMPSPEDAAQIARLAARANKGLVVTVPTGHGFCLYIRADCLHRTGLFRANLFAQGYGEENDFCERARAAGFRHVAVPGVYVAHQGGASFGGAKYHLLRRNIAILRNLHPTYMDRVEAFIEADGLRDARARLDAARLRADHAGAAETVLIITHATRGGTTRVVEDRAAAARARGAMPLLLRGDEGVTLLGDEGAYPNLRFTLPGDGDALLRLLRAVRPSVIELHHLMGHHAALMPLLARLALPLDIWVHDYGCICPRLTLVTGDNRFCGEAPVEICRPCVAQWGQAFTPPIDAADLRRQSAALYAAARRVVVSSADVAARIRRHFPASRLEMVPLQADPPAATRAPRRARAPGAPMTIAVIGAIGQAKGYDMLLACAEDAAARNLPLRFVVVGFTSEDTPLMRTGRIFITGPYKAPDAAALVASVGADIAFLPSIWPETWCFALTDAWDGGLDAVVFDLGTPAERVRRTGRGVVLPLGLPPAAVNDALLNPQTLACRSAW
jgi:GT2 family glycosyltransferase/glycosyltransferase involved in cell wall biosynthesis